MPKLALCMIVRDEAHIIERCIRDAAPIVEHVILVDTGSTDQTTRIAYETCTDLGLRFDLTRTNWTGFADARNAALTYADSATDCQWLLMIDADEKITLKEGHDYKINREVFGNDKDVMYVESIMGGTSWYRPQLIRNGANVRWRGVVHEFLDAPAEKFGTWRMGYNTPIQDSARNKAGTGKYRRDAETLKRAIEELEEYGGPDEDLLPRYQFYLAMSLYNSGDYNGALDWFLIRASEDRGYIQERYIAYWHAAKCSELTRCSPEVTIGRYLKAYDYYPPRVEAIHDLARYCREEELWTIGYKFCEMAASIVRPAPTLFDEAWRYEYGALDELALAYVRMGQAGSARAVAKHLLTLPTLPAVDRERITANLAALEEASG